MVESKEPSQSAESESGQEGPKKPFRRSYLNCVSRAEAYQGLLRAIEEERRRKQRPRNWLTFGLVDDDGNGEPLRKGFK